jgi:hypothetical protein
MGELPDEWLLRDGWGKHTIISRGPEQSAGDIAAAVPFSRSDVLLLIFDAWTLFR